MDQRTESLFPHRPSPPPCRWEPSSAVCAYMVRIEPSTGAVYADEQLLQELEVAGYKRSLLLQVWNGVGVRVP